MLLRLLLNRIYGIYCFYGIYCVFSGDRVVWLDSKDQAELGTVHWIGALDDSVSEWTVGVEFVRENIPYSL